MLYLTTQRQHTLKQQTVSQYHLLTAKFFADTALYMRLKYPYTCQTNDVTTFDVTDETHRLCTFNDNWDQALYDVKDFANEGFFHYQVQTLISNVFLAELYSQNSRPIHLALSFIY